MSKKSAAPHGATRFAQIPTCAFNDKRLTAEQLATLGYLASYLNSRSDPWWPILQQHVADVRGISRETCNRHIKHLVKLGYIYQESRYRRDGGQAESYYMMHMDMVIPAEFERAPTKRPDEEQSEREPPRGVIVDTPCDPGVTPLCPQDHTPVIVGSHPRDPGVTPNIRMTYQNTDHLTDQKTDAPPSPEIEQEPDPDHEPNVAQLQTWCRTLGKRAYAPALAERGYWAYSDAIKCWREWKRGLRTQESRAHNGPLEAAVATANIRAATG